MKPESTTMQVFISYTRKDKVLANTLARLLQKEGFTIWIDLDISAGANWSDEINKGLNESDFMIALLDQHSFSSSYVRDELQFAFFDDRFKNRLLPVLISQTPDTDFVRLPWVLTKLNFIKIKEQPSKEKMAKTIAKEFIAILKSQDG